MNKVLIIFCLVSLIFIVGCTTGSTNEGKNKKESSINILEKKKTAMSDVIYAQLLGNSIMRSLADETITEFDSNQELTKDSSYGKALLKGYVSEIEKPKMKDTYKYFVTVTKDMKITVKTGETSTTAVQLYPKPERYEAPYDVLNK